MYKKNILCCFIFCGVLKILSANSPYEIKDFFIKNDGEGATVLEFEVTNTGKKLIVGFELAFNLTDLNGENPFEDDNSFLLKADCFLEVNSSEVFELTIEEPAYLEDKTELTVNNIFFRQVFFFDGSKWKDFFGMYSL